MVVNCVSLRLTAKQMWTSEADWLKGNRNTPQQYRTALTDLRSVMCTHMLGCVYAHACVWVGGSQLTP